MKIHTIDLMFMGNPNAIAAYLIESEAGPFIIETGPTSCNAALQAGLAAHGYQASDIKHVLLTHIHFDHAGGAGWWGQQGAQIYVHNFGAKHMIDPSRLYASALRIYGDLMETMYGEMVPIPSEQVTLLYDQDVIEIGEHTLIAHDTPGHAKHHMTFQLGDIAFTGDAAGMRMFQPSPYTKVPAPPPEYNLEVWQETLAKLIAFDFKTIYPTHFGPVETPLPHLEAMVSNLNHITQLVGNAMQAGMEREAIIARYTQAQTDIALSAGVPEDVWHKHITDEPFDMSIDGIMRYWKKRAEAEA